MILDEGKGAKQTIKLSCSVQGITFASFKIKWHLGFSFGPSVLPQNSGLSNENHGKYLHSVIPLRVVMVSHGSLKTFWFFCFLKTDPQRGLPPVLIALLSHTSTSATSLPKEPCIFQTKCFQHRVKCQSLIEETPCPSKTHAQVLSSPCFQSGRPISVIDDFSLVSRVQLEFHCTLFPRCKKQTEGLSVLKCGKLNYIGLHALQRSHLHLTPPLASSTTKVPL